MNALDVGKKYGVDPKVLLTPRIAQMKVKTCSLDAGGIHTCQAIGVVTA